MYLQILRRDLKRKKTTNIILLLFIMLASMFISASAGNILTITGGVDYFFEQAGINDYVLFALDDGQEIEQKILSADTVQDWTRERLLFVDGERVTYKGERLVSTVGSAPVITDIQTAGLTYFHEDNTPVTEVNKGEVFISGYMMESQEIQPGDVITVKLDDGTLDLKVAGAQKDALFGPRMMSNERLLVNHADYQTILSRRDNHIIEGTIYYLKTDDVPALETAVCRYGTTVGFNGSADFLKMTYIMDIIVAGLMIAASVILILVALGILRFTIHFTLSEEYREIGVMRAIGLPLLRIRSLYMVKYCTLAVIGASVGLACSIPLSDVLLRSVSRDMLLPPSSSWINVACSLGIVAAVFWFCYSCTGKIKKLSPVDAIRNGQTGERFRKKSLLHLHKSPARPTLFIAVNDLLSSPRRYAAVILVFMLCLSLLFVVCNTAYTMRSDDIISAFGVAPSDAYIERAIVQTASGNTPLKSLREQMRENEQKLENAGIPARCGIQVLTQYTLQHGDKMCKASTQIGLNIPMDDYPCFAGVVPQADDEIMITQAIADSLGVTVGDTVTIPQLGGTKQYTVTGLFQAMNNLGKAAQLPECAAADTVNLSGSMAMQVTFTDSPTAQQRSERMQEMKKLYGEENVLAPGEYAENLAGVAGVLDSVNMLLAGIVIIIAALVSVLIERSFVTKERNEIALMKALGFVNRNIIHIHTLRFTLAALAAAVLAWAASPLLTQLCVGPIFHTMGATEGVRIVMDPAKVFGVYPLLIIVTVALSAWAAALTVRGVSASEISDIE